MKLSKSQRAVVDKMREGCRLYRTKRIAFLVIGDTMRVDGEIRLNTFESLNDKGIIEFEHDFIGSQRYRLTERYKQSICLHERRGQSHMHDAGYCKDCGMEF